MSIGWSEIISTPDVEAVNEIASAWGWLIQEPFIPLLFSVLGDMFFQKEAGKVFWLNTGTGEISAIADSVEEFKALLGTEAADDWLLPSLVAQLHEAGKIPAPGCCYTYVTLPVFAEGKYQVANLNPVPAKEHFGVTGHIHQQIQSLPDETQINLQVAP